ncbi:MAG TPA: hypothetical protein VIL30_07080 [Ramlibacter sp.]|jgi:hypothetical protein
MTKTAQTESNASKPGRQYGMDAFDYHDDVTKEAVDKVRTKAKPQLDKADLELVDGLGQYSI